MIKISNIFQFPELSFNSSEELFEDIFKNDNFRIEKIYSTGQSTPDGVWLVENVDEFVFLVEGRASILMKDNTIFNLEKGDYFIIPKNTEHRVENTAKDKITTWLTIHFK